jgi:hypothetical protein
MDDLGYLSPVHEPGDEDGAVDNAEDVRYAEFDALLEQVVNGTPDALTPLIELGENLLDSVSHDERPYLLHVLGLAYMDRYDAAENGGPAADRDRVIQLFGELRELLPADDPEAGPTRLRLGLALALRCLDEHPADLAVVSEAINTLAGVPAETAVPESVAVLARLRLGQLYVTRYFLTAGAVEDRAKAIEALTEVAESSAVAPELAQTSRLTLAQLELTRAVPVGAPTDFADLTEDAVRDLYARLDPHDHEVGAAGAAAQAHLDVIAAAGPGTALDSRALGVTRAMATLARATSAGQLTPADVQTAVSGLETLLEDEEPDSPQAGVLTAFMSALAARGAPDGAEESPAPHLDQILTVLRGIGDHPTRPLLVDALAAVALAPIPQALEANPRGTNFDQLEEVLAQLADHSSRPEVLFRLGMAALGHAAIDKDTDTLAKLPPVLRAGIDEAGTTPHGAALTLLLGWTTALRGGLNGDVGAVNEAIELLKSGLTALPADHELRSLQGPYLSVLLLMRFSLTRNLEDIDATRYYGAPVELDTPDERLAEQLASVNTIVARLTPVLTRLLLTDSENPDSLDEMITDLDRMVDEMSASDRILYGWELVADIVRMFRSATTEDGADFPRTGPNTVAYRAAGDAFLRRSTTIDEDSIFDWRAEQAMVLIGTGFAASDVTRIDEGIRVLRELCPDTDLVRDRLNYLGSLGFGLRMRHLLQPRPEHIEEAIARLEEARMIFLSEPGLADTAATYNMLGDCYFARGDENRRDRRRAVIAGLDGLAARVRQVLLQTSPQRALDAARAAEGEAAMVATWSIAGGDHGSAVQALELGRAMVLHSATVEADVPGLLRAGGHPDLARRWEEQSRQQAPWDQPGRIAQPFEVMAMDVPDSFRREVFLAVEDTEVERNLLSPPSVADIVSTLDASGSAALVYLVPRDDDKGSFAVVVRADGVVDHLPLPGLHNRKGGHIRRFEQSQREVAQPGDGADLVAAHKQWAWTAAGLSDWAWTVAMGPILDAVRVPEQRGAPRIVLVPVGKLGAVPWHAARRPVTGGVRYACQDAAISYAASARQFADATRRPRGDWADHPALVGTAEARQDGLVWVDAELTELNRRYPGATRVDGRVGPADVAALLPHRGGPGVSVLHLSCHAFRADPPIDSYLHLDGDTRLTVRDILRQAADRPADAPGPLVVLAACATDLTGTFHDEALTLATAFLAGGATGTLGARWPVRDRPTALFMIMFHHYLNSGFPDPPAALRATQLWMLDPARRLPPGIRGPLAAHASRRTLGDIANWAGFTYQGR